MEDILILKERLKDIINKIINNNDNMINEDDESNECFNIYYFILIGEKIQNFFSNKNKINCFNFYNFN